MILRKITNTIKNELHGCDEKKMYDLMLNHYQIFNLIDNDGNWATKQLKEISEDLLPKNFTEERSKSFVDEMAKYAEQNLYLMDFLESVNNETFPYLSEKVKKEGYKVLPDVISYAIVLNNLTKVTYDNPKILENCVKIFEEARHNTNASKHIPYFHKIKFISVDPVIKSFIYYHETRKIPKSYGRLGLVINVLEAAMFDFISGFRDNAKTALTLVSHRIGSKKIDTKTGSGPSTWSEDRKAISMSLTKEWCDLYQTWNMAFVSQFNDFPYIIPKLIIPQVANYQNVPTSYMYKRALALYLYLNYVSLDYVEKAKNNESSIQWNDKKLTKIWGKINLKSAKKYNTEIKLKNIFH